MLDIFQLGFAATRFWAGLTINNKGKSMHNLHLILINADTAKDAAEDAKLEITDWGSDDNWRCVGGVASENGADDIENHENSRWGLSFIDGDKLPQIGTYFQRTIAYHQQQIRPPIKLEYAPHGEFADFQSALKAVTNELQKLTYSNISQLDLYGAEKNIKYLSELFDASKSLESGGEIPEFFSWQFDHNGLTDLTAQSEGVQRYIVFLDTHS
jgi:hypothetical protein